VKLLLTDEEGKEEKEERGRERKQGGMRTMVWFDQL
jgi:hypothetical protein